jgi:hypothetical protein
MKRLAIGFVALVALAAPAAAQELPLHLEPLPFHLEPVELAHPLYRPGWEQYPYQTGGCHSVRVQQRRVLRDGRVVVRTVRRCV